MDAEKLCGFGKVARSLFERAEDELLFQVAYGVVIFSGPSARGRRRVEERLGKIFWEEQLRGADDHGALDGVFQFTDVTWPIILEEASAGVIGDAADKAIALLGVAIGEISGE